MWRALIFGLCLGVLTVIGPRNTAIAQEPKKDVWTLTVRDDSAPPVDGWQMPGSPQGETRSQGFVTGNGVLCRVNDRGITSRPIHLFGSHYTGGIAFAILQLRPGDLIILGQRGSGSESEMIAWLLADLDRDLGPVPMPVGTSAGWSISTGNTLGDLTSEVVLGAPPGVPGQVHVVEFNRTGSGISFFPFGPSFTGGVRVATGDLNGDGFDDVLSTQVNGGAFAAHEIRQGSEPRLIGDGFPYGEQFTAGVWTSAFDIDGDGIAEVFTGAGTGAPIVRVFNVAGPSPTMVGNFTAFGPNATGGARVSTGFVKDHPAVAVTSGSNVRMFQYGTDVGELNGAFRFDTGFNEHPFGSAPVDGMDFRLYTPPR